VPVPQRQKHRRRGLLYPIKPEPGLMGPACGSTNFEKATAEGGSAPANAKSAFAGTPVLCHTSIGRVTGRSACATNPKASVFFRTENWSNSLKPLRKTEVGSVREAGHHASRRKRI
jgi:hypothetical protein